MNKNILALISFALFFWTIPVCAVPVIVVVADANVNLRDRVIFPLHLSDISKMATQKGINVKFASLNLQKLENLGPGLDQIIQGDDVLAGVILLGHGSQRNYALSANAKYDGETVAQILSLALKDRPLSENFLVYLGSCRTGNPSEDNSHFLESLGKGLSDFKSSGLQTNEMALIGHSYSTTYAGLRPPTRIQDLIIRFIPKTIKNVFLKLDPASAMMYPVLAGMLTTELAVLGHVFFMHPHNFLSFTLKVLEVSLSVAAPLMPLSMAFDKIVRKVTVQRDGTINIEEGLGNSTFFPSLSKACDSALTHINQLEPVGTF